MRMASIGQLLTSYWQIIDEKSGNYGVRFAFNVILSCIT